MPALARPEHFRRITLPPREAIVAADCDVLVVGGGPAGFGAALGAARGGARVILAERYGFLGGNATAALVVAFMSYYTEHHTEEHSDISLLPTDHGRGRPVIRGVLAELVRKLVKAGGAVAPSLATGFTVPFDAEIFKLVCEDMLHEAGVEILFHVFASGVLENKKHVDGVIFESKSGPLVVRAKIVIDCTGDGDVAAAAGSVCETGREEDGLVQPMSLLFRLGEYEKAAFAEYVKQHPDQWQGVHGLWAMIDRAEAAGELDLQREDILMFRTPRDREIYVNSIRVCRVLGTDVWDLTLAEVEGRRQMRRLVSFFKRYVPGFNQTYVLQSGPSVGVRESRRIIGGYKLTAEDILHAREFKDVIARSTYPLDIHNPKGKGTLMKRLPAGKAYDIPLRCLLPQGMKNLLVAGRCISGSADALASFRVMPVCIATGQAAGVCAAVSRSLKLLPKQVPVEKVQKALLAQDADLGSQG